MKAACGQSLVQNSGAKTILCVFRKRQAVNIGYARCIMYQTKTRLGIKNIMALNIQTLTRSMDLLVQAAAAALSLTKRLMTSKKYAHLSRTLSKRLGTSSGIVIVIGSNTTHTSRQERSRKRKKDNCHYLNKENDRRERQLPSGQKEIRLTKV